ncbi:MAG: helix-turn-helix domain-containing protein [Blastocatellia bacterium]
MGEIKLRLQDVARKRGVGNPFALSKISGLNYAVCYKLWHEQVHQITFPTLARLCEALECGAGDLLEFNGLKNSTSRRR